MQRSSSEPDMFRRSMRRQTGGKPPTRYSRDSAPSKLTGELMIMATPTSPKAMHVIFTGNDEKLYIDMLQHASGEQETFQVCDLEMKHLGVARQSHNMFVLAVVHGQRMHHEIYCRPLDASADSWIRFFESKNVPSMQWFSSRPLCSLNARCILSPVDEMLE